MAVSIPPWSQSWVVILLMYSIVGLPVAWNFVRKADRSWTLLALSLLTFLLAVWGWNLAVLGQTSNTTTVNATVEDVAWDNVGDTRFYHVEMRYVYFYDGERYEDARIWAGKANNNVLGAREAREIAADFEQGETIEIQVNPDNPSYSYIREMPFIYAKAYRLLILTPVWYALTGYLLTKVEDPVADFLSDRARIEGED